MLTYCFSLSRGCIGGTACLLDIVNFRSNAVSDQPLVFIFCHLEVFPYVLFYGFVLHFYAMVNGIQGESGL